MKTFLISFAFTAFFSALITQSFAQINTTKKSFDSSISGSWQLQPVLASDTAAGKIPILNFSLTDHHFSGNTGCNSISGQFTLRGDSLAFSEQIITTKMACPGYNEKAFIDNLTRTTHFKIENGVLELLAADKSVLSKWARKGVTKALNKI